MTPPETNTTDRPSRVWGCGIGVLSGIMLSILLAAALIWMYSSVGLLQVLRATFGSGKTQILVGQPTVVRQIQQLQRLETVVYTLEKIIIGKRENRFLPSFLAGDRVLLIVHGEVIAGVDLGKVRPEDVTVTGRAIQVRLPKAEIFTTRLDNSKTQVYSRDTGVFSSVDPNLETEVRREGERQLHEAALKNSILQLAEQNARSTLMSMLKGFGFEQAEVR